MWFVIIENEGPELIGPFETSEEADEWADQAAVAWQKDAWVVEPAAPFGVRKEVG